MARESQGLQFALIAFVLLSIVFGVLAYMSFAQYEKALAESKAAKTEAANQSAAAKEALTLADELREVIGVAKTDDRAKIHETFNNDMKTYAGTSPEKSVSYRRALEYLATVVKEKNTQLTDAKAAADRLTQEKKDLAASIEKQVNDFKQAVAQSNNELTAAREAYNTDRERLKGEYSTVAGELQKARKEKDTAINTAKAEVQEANVALQKWQNRYKDRTKAYNDVVKETLDLVDGVVRWVDQRSGVVWVNLGAADSLARQTTFNVYPADVTDVKKAGKKASIEITQILGDHLAEARITDDNPADPILPGDKINTPVWSPGEKQHFALAGFIDIDGDGKSDQKLLENLITLNGGTVDCQVDEKGKRIGEMTVGTRYLVLGEAPEKGTREMIDAYTKMIGDANNLGVQKTTVRELLSRMGWKNQSKVVRLGPGLNPADVRAKLPEGTPPQPSGKESPLFKHRHPPTVPPSTY